MHRHMRVVFKSTMSHRSTRPKSSKDLPPYVACEAAYNIGKRAVPVELLPPRVGSLGGRAVN